MVIDVNTKIAGILKQSADALEAIVSISPKFEKLRNPILRRLMAGRTSIATASKIAGVSVNDFFLKLKSLGFEIDDRSLPEEKEKKDLTAFFNNIRKDQVTELDVRPLIAAGNDPLGEIIKKIELLQPEQVLKIVNSFYPQPLILLLEKQGFDSFVDTIDDNLVETYFYKKHATPIDNLHPGNQSSKGWDSILQKFNDRIQTIDVRQLEMPLPMITILEALDSLAPETALFVYHKRIPVFLLPELASRNLSYRIKEISEGQVNLLIYKESNDWRGN